MCSQRSLVAARRAAGGSHPQAASASRMASIASSSVSGVATSYSGMVSDRRGGEHRLEVVLRGHEYEFGQFGSSGYVAVMWRLCGGWGLRSALGAL